MKKLLLIASTCLVISQVNAQRYAASEQEVSMDKSMVNAWVIATGDDEPVKDLRKSYARYAKDQLDVKAKKDGRDMVVSKEASVPRISSNVGDLKAKFFSEGQQTLMAVAFMPGYDQSLNTLDNPTEMENLRRFAKDFVKHYQTEKLTAQLEDQEKRQKTLESNYKKNQREHKKLNKNLDKIAKKLNSDKTDDTKKFELENDKIADEARIMALDEIMANQNQEIEAVERSIQDFRSKIGELESLFAEPMAQQENIYSPQAVEPAEDPAPIPSRNSSPDVDY
ncbi:MAG: hypothetical protein WA958_13295 [Tunicatimonas sp.]